MKFINSNRFVIDLILNSTILSIKHTTGLAYLIQPVALLLRPPTVSILRRATRDFSEQRRCLGIGAFR